MLFRKLFKKLQDFAINFPKKRLALEISLADIGMKMYLPRSIEILLLLPVGSILTTI